MSKLKVMVVAAVAAVGIFLAGALGPRDTRAEAPDPSRTADLSSLSSPASSMRGVDATIARLEERLQQGGDLRVRSELGLAYLQKAKGELSPELLPRAQAMFDDVLSEDPTDFRALIGSALIANSFHRFDEMETLARRAIESNPYSALGYGVLGDSFVYRERLDEARRALQEMLDRGPDMPGFTRVSYLYEQLGDGDKARLWMKQALDASVSAEDIAYTSYHLGVLQLADGDRAAALRLFELGRQRAPESAHPMAGLALAAFDQRDIDGAIEWMTRAAEVRPALEFLAPLAELHAAAGNEEESRDAYAAASELEQAFMDAGALADPELTIFMTDAGRADEALALATELYDEQGPNVATDEAMGWSLTSSGEPAEGLRYLKRSIAGGGDSHTHYFAAIASLELGRDVAAQRYLAKALKIDPNFSYRYALDAERLLEDLKG